MELKLKKKINETDLDLILIPVLENNLNRVLKDLALEKKAHLENFQGKKDQILITDHTIVLGTGQEKKLEREDWRILAANIIAYLKKYQAHKIGLRAAQYLKGNNNIKDLGQALAEGLLLANYSFLKYKKEDEDTIKVKIENIIVEIKDEDKLNFKKGWAKGLLLAQGTIKGRDLVNEPAGIMTPTFLANEALEIAQDNSNISVKVLEKKEIKKLGMTAFLGVDQGSDQDPKFIHLVYKPKGKVKDRIGIVGKGITFDSGGLNIKVGDSMADMKIDMGGAATVIGLFSVLGKLKPLLEVHGIIAACENMPSGKALKPGDVISNMQGKSIEIGNTDAEGRVTLADSLAYAQKEGLKTIIDLATLTGAIMIGLGSNYAGLYSNDNKLNNSLLKSAKVAGEKLWSMPLPQEYQELNKSNIADIKNIASTRYGGSITAALFLQFFIEDSISWAHLDIAGPAYAEKPLNNYTPVGGVGFGIRTLLEYLLEK